MLAYLIYLYCMHKENCQKLTNNVMQANAICSMTSPWNEM